MKKKNKRVVDSFIVTKEDGSYDLVGAEILKRYSIKTQRDETGSKQIKSDGWNYTSNTYDDALLEPLYDPKQLCELLELNIYHENCVDVISRDAAGISYDFVPVTGEKEDLKSKPSLDVLFPQLSDNINQLLYQMNYDRKTTGYGALELIRESTSDSLPVNLSHIPSYTLRRTRDGKRAVQQVGTKRVWFVLYGKNIDHEGNLCDVHSETGEFHPYNSLSPDDRANELLWSMSYNPKSKYYGLSKIIGSIPTIHGDISRNNYNTMFFRNYGMPAFAVIVTGDFQDYEEEPYLESGEPNPDYDVTRTLRYRISQQLREVIHNPHSAVSILVPSEGEEGNVGVELKPLSVETKEASFRLYRLDNRDEVIQSHRVPPYKLGINENGSLGGSNISTATINYKNDVVAPIRADDETLINTLLKHEYNLNSWSFKIIEHDNRDYAGDVAIIKELFNMACMTPRQIIENIGDKFGLTAPPENIYLDEYYLGGQPLRNVWNNVSDNPNLESKTILDTLDTYLWGENKDDKSITKDEAKALNEFED